MSPLLFLAVALAGGAGAALRFAVDTTVRSRRRYAVPLGTLLINLTGSFALGLVTALAARSLLDPSWALVLGAGLLGGYTTFSTASVEVVRLVQERRRGAALALTAGMLGGAVLAAVAGYGMVVAFPAS